MLSIVIPAYNEQKRISSTVESVVRFLADQQILGEIIVVDDGSKDTTREVVDNLSKQYSNLSLVVQPFNQGKGAAVAAGILQSKGDVVLFMDADSATPITEFPKLQEFIDAYDIVIGSRTSVAQTDAPVLRKIISRLGRFVIHILLPVNVTDTQCGFKLFKAPVAKELAKKLKTKRFGFDVELLMRARKNNYKIKEVPVKWNHQDESAVNPFTDAIRTLIDIIKIWYLITFNK